MKFKMVATAGLFIVSEKKAFLIQFDFEVVVSLTLDFRSA
jgi:hypothetical protein